VENEAVGERYGICHRGSSHVGGLLLQSAAQRDHVEHNPSSDIDDDPTNYYLIHRGPINDHHVRCDAASYGRRVSVTNRQHQLSGHGHDDEYKCVLRHRHATGARHNDRRWVHHHLLGTELSQ
jgi:hypothetical protein